MQSNVIGRISGLIWRGIFCRLIKSRESKSTSLSSGKQKNCQELSICTNYVHRGKELLKNYKVLKVFTKRIKA